MEAATTGQAGRWSSGWVRPGAVSVWGERACMCDPSRSPQGNAAQTGVPTGPRVLGGGLAAGNGAEPQHRFLLSHLGGGGRGSTEGRPPDWPLLGPAALWGVGGVLGAPTFRAGGGAPSRW